MRIAFFTKKVKLSFVVVVDVVKVVDDSLAVVIAVLQVVVLVVAVADVVVVAVVVVVANVVVVAAAVGESFRIEIPRLDKKMDSGENEFGSELSSISEKHPH